MHKPWSFKGIVERWQLLTTWKDRFKFNVMRYLIALVLLTACSEKYYKIHKMDERIRMKKSRMTMDCNDLTLTR